MYLKVPKVNCAVIGRTNSTYRLKKWKKELCNEHQQIIRREECQLCEKPFLLYKFPSENQKNKERQLWVKALRREFINKTLWQPTGSDRVCSIHFVDGIPSTAPYAYFMSWI